MAITIDDFAKVWASQSPLTPYEFSESNYKEGWNFIGGTPPSRQMWDFLQKNNDEKMQYLANNYLPLSGGTVTGDLTVTGTLDGTASGNLPLSGGTATGNIIAPSFQTGDNDSHYFQCRKFRGEGNADSYYHAVDFGYSGHNHVDFYEYGGVWNFYRSRRDEPATLVGAITVSAGWDGLVKGQDITTYAKKSDISTSVSTNTLTVTGETSVPTANAGNSSKAIANTEWVQKLLADALAKQKAVPTGVVQAFAGRTTPQGWLLCDGSAVSRTDYAALYAVIGTTYGAGNGSTTFNLPNLVDKFVEGSATAGTVKSAGLPNITGSASVRQYVALGSGRGALKGDSGDNTSAPYVCALDSTSKGQGSIDLDASKSNSIYGNSTTVQPPALTMRYIIKY